MTASRKILLGLVLARDARAKEPRRSILRDVLHWER
jgi:hypothetical protein